MTPRQTVFDDIWNERDSQLGILAPDTTLPLFEWLNFIDEHLLRARRAETLAEATDEIRNLAACAVAAMEAHGSRSRADRATDILGAGQGSGPEDIGHGPLRVSALAGLMQSSFGKLKRPSNKPSSGKRTVDANANADEDGA